MFKHRAIQSVQTKRLEDIRSKLLSKRNRTPLAVCDTLLLSVVTSELDRRWAQ